ncbi:MAG: helix-turn-helix domain-containing protein [Spirulina sp.]
MTSLKDLGDQFLNDAGPSTASLYSFRDIDELAVFLPEDVRLTPLECEPFRCQSAFLNLGAVQFTFNHVNRNLYATGGKQTDFLSFSMILQGNGQHGIENNRLVNEDYLFGFDPSRKADLVFPGNCLYCAVYIQPTIFKAYVQAMDRLDLDSKFLATNYAYIAGSFAPLRSYLKQIYALLIQQSNRLQNRDFQKIIVQDFIPLLIAALPVGSSSQNDTKFLRRSRLVKQADDYMQSRLDQALTLTDLCEALGTSSRALCYGFQEMFGTSPMSYLKILRLKAAHQLLKTASQNAITVTESATQFGFCHLGYFSRDYKQMFGELPSATLRQRL